MTDKRKILLDHANANGGQITTQEANNLLKHRYYHNHEHYVSDILSRLVKSGVLIREKKGHYVINWDNRLKAKYAGVPESQAKLF